MCVQVAHLRFSSKIPQYRMASVTSGCHVLVLPRLCASVSKRGVWSRSLTCFVQPLHNLDLLFPIVHPTFAIKTANGRTLMPNAIL